MFGGSKVVRATAGRRINAAALQPLLDGGTLAATLIVEAGNLKPTDAMRGLFEKSAQAAAVACYADEARDLEGVIAETLKAHGLGITSDAREMLVARMGADRAMSRGEIEKLALYASGKTRDRRRRRRGHRRRCLRAGHRPHAQRRGLRRCGTAPSPSSPAPSPPEKARKSSSLPCSGYLQRLHRIRTDLDAGASFEDVIRQQRPPVHFKQKDALGLQCRIWSSRASFRPWRAHPRPQKPPALPHRWRRRSPRNC